VVNSEVLDDTASSDVPSCLQQGANAQRGGKDVSVNWADWPPGWPVNERFLQLQQTCRRCGRQLQGTWGRGTPTGWMHRECAIAYAAQHTAALTAANAALPPVYLISEEEEEFLNT
jgi:hypothetical protein